MSSNRLHGRKDKDWILKAVKEELRPYLCCISALVFLSLYCFSNWYICLSANSCWHDNRFSCSLPMQRQMLKSFTSIINITSFKWAFTGFEVRSVLRSHNTISENHKVWFKNFTIFKKLLMAVSFPVFFIYCSTWKQFMYLALKHWQHACPHVLFIIFFFSEGVCVWERQRNAL